MQRQPSSSSAEHTGLSQQQTVGSVSHVKFLKLVCFSTLIFSYCLSTGDLTARKARPEYPSHTVGQGPSAASEGIQLKTSPDDNNHASNNDIVLMKRFAVHDELSRNKSRQRHYQKTGRGGGMKHSSMLV